MVKTILPSLKDLEQIRGIIKNIPNQRGEILRKVHYGCYLLCSQSGLRISEAVKFDLNAKTRKGLYRIEKPKGKKERYVAVPEKVIRELKENNWKPCQTNRHNFYHFLKKIKQKSSISPKVELTPHNLRKAFATYHAEAGLPLPLLSKLLGHSSIRTTALYWQDIYGEDDTDDILIGKKWLETKFGDKQRPKPSQKEPTEPLKSPTKGNLPKPLPKNPDSDIVKSKSLTFTEIEKRPTITNYQPQTVIKQILPKEPEKFLLDTSEQLPVIANRKQPTDKEKILLAKIKQLEEQLAKVQAENNYLKLENKHLKSLIRKDQATEAKILQPLPWKSNR